MIIVTGSARKPLQGWNNKLLHFPSSASLFRHFLTALYTFSSSVETHPTSGLWMKTLAGSVLSTMVTRETCTGCCRSSFMGLVINMKFVWLEQTFRKPTKVVSKKYLKKRRRWWLEINIKVNRGQERRTAVAEASHLTLDCHQPFDGDVVHVHVMRLHWGCVVSRLKIRPAHSRSAACTKFK